MAASLEGSGPRWRVRRLGVWSPARFAVLGVLVGDEVPVVEVLFAEALVKTLLTGRSAALESCSSGRNSESES